tara:strand:- start:10372 stop:10572 length:201 start_codon:yes stop_codon:yes gene_type:complete
MITQSIELIEGDGDNDVFTVDSLIGCSQQTYLKENLIASFLKSDLRLLFEIPSESFSFSLLLKYNG